jgi:hypothetical protein
MIRTKLMNSKQKATEKTNKMERWFFRRLMKLVPSNETDKKEHKLLISAVK